MGDIMSFVPGGAASATAMMAEKIRLDVIANNIANQNTTQTADGGPYRRQTVVFSEVMRSLQDRMGDPEGFTGQGVRVEKIVDDTAPPKMVFDPSHPDANEEGFVAYPNVSVIKEMVDMMTATRAYDANAAVMRSAKSMVDKALRI